MMMLFKKRMSYFKKKKIWKYLNNLGDNQTAFDQLVRDCLDGTLKKELLSYRFKHFKVHLDWDDNVKCLRIKGKYLPYYMYIDIQIYPDEFIVSYGADEPTEGVTYPLVSRDQVYETLLNIIKLIHVKFS